MKLKELFSAHDMTAGPPWQRIMEFAVPMLVGNLAQQLYNTADSIVVGHYVGDNALAAVGSASPILNLLLALFVGVSTGAGIVISQNYGAGQYDRCRRIFRQSMLLSVSCCAILNIIIFMYRHDMAGIFTNSSEVISYAASRISIVLLFQFIASSYEISGACLRGLGYSMTPTAITIFGTCLFRLLWIYAINPAKNYECLLWVYPISWVITGAIVIAAYIIITRRLFNKPPLSLG